MTVDEILSFVTDLGGVALLQPMPGDGTPEISWGDTFIYYSPDGTIPTTTQPFATIVTKDYPDDERSGLDRPDTFRLNIAAGTQAFLEVIGHAPREPGASDVDPSVPDTVFAHPVYGALGWLAVVDPGERSEVAARDLLRTAHHLARSRYERRSDSAGS